MQARQHSLPKLMTRHGSSRSARQICAAEYLLRVVRSGGPPGARTPVHTPRSETFYVLTGELTQQTPEGVNRVSTALSMLGHPPNTPMQVPSSGTNDLSALVMFVNDATGPFRHQLHSGRACSIVVESRRGEH